VEKKARYTPLSGLWLSKKRISTMVTIEGSAEIVRLINKLEELVSSLNIPNYRKRDYRWLRVNITRDMVNKGFYVEMMKLIERITILNNDCILSLSEFMDKDL